MKLISVRTARSIWFLPLHLINPKGAFLRPAIPLLQQRYAFATSPSERTPVDAEGGLKFADGAYETNQGSIAIDELSIYRDGVLASSRSSTADTDAFLSDALTFVSEQFSLPAFGEFSIKKAYASELNVMFDRPLQLLNPALAPFSEKLTSAISNEQLGPFDFLTLSLGPDPTRGERAPFRIEREIRTSFSENRYYSSAAMPTENHLRVLAELERTVS